ncbi:hypothetical protein ACHQM5_029784 [Ranunculus cassubicifolius]
MSSSIPIGLIRMATDLQLSEAKYKNFLFSPCCIQLTLSLLANGAKGSTSKELLELLEAKNLTQVNSIVPKMIQNLTGSSRGEPRIAYVSGLWVDKSLTLNPTFKIDAKNIFKTEAKNNGFQENINEKLAMDGGGKGSTVLVNNVIPGDSFCLPIPTSIVLANALYFSGKWSKRFDKSLTIDSEFYLSDRNWVNNVPFMRSTKDQFIETFKDFKILRMSYKSIDRDISMYIILPHEKNGLWDLLEKVRSDPLFLTRDLHKISKKAKVGRFMIPKFKFTYMFEASDVLKRIGVIGSFTNLTDFGEMVQGLEHGKWLRVLEWLRILELRHDGGIQVDEDGTNTASRTSTRSRVGCVRQQPRVDFVADHPFMYMVRDDVTGMVLFMGHVINPRSGGDDDQTGAVCCALYLILLSLFIILFIDQ